MRFGFSDDIVCDLDAPLDPQKMTELAMRIEAYYQVVYFWRQTKKGYRLEPVNPKWSSKGSDWWPILTFIEKDGKVTIRRHPGPFMYLGFFLLACFEARAIYAWITGNLGNPVIVLLLMIMAVFNYVICKDKTETAGKRILQCVADVLRK